MTTVSIVIIGDEILLGKVTDTNSGAISRAFDRAGARTVAVRTVGDNGDDIRRAVTDGMAEADVVITTGGLGPTKDDITKHILADIFGGPMVRNAAVTANVTAIFAARNLPMNQLTLDQALVPASARIINNDYGTAPIMVFERDGHTVLSMPGVPVETEGMLPKVVDDIMRRYGHSAGMRHTTRVVTGLSESALARWLDDFESALPVGYKLAYLPDSPVIKLRLDGPADSDAYDNAVSALDSRLATNADITVLAREDVSVAEALVRRLADMGLTMSTAESCTGGNIAHNITMVPGSSQVFNGGAVTYANSAKINVLGVPAEDIAADGAVSQSVVLAMTAGACRVFGTDCAVATSGIAGPSGGSPDKPVGTVWISVRTPAGAKAAVYHFRGDRKQVINRATVTAMILLLKELGR